MDDEKDITDVIKLAFESQDSNLKVDTYNNPLLALQKFRKGIYDFILLDIRMTPIDGIELYKKVRNIDKKVKVFIFTATDPGSKNIGKSVLHLKKNILSKNQFHCRSYCIL